MSGSVIGALRVVLGADTAALDKGLEGARGNLAKFASDIATTGAAIGAAITAAYATVAIGVNNTLKSMDEMGKQAQKIGIPVEQLSALKLAADLSGVSMEQLGTGVGKLSKAMVEAASKPTSEAANAFRALGVSVTDSNGKLIPTQDLLLSIADKFAGLKDGAGKTAAAIAIFGKSGAEMIPFLNEGRAGLQGMVDNAQKFGIVIDGPTAAAAQHFRDTLTQLGAVKDGLIVKLTAYLLPALQTFADRMLAGASDADKQTSKLNFLKTAFDGLVRVVMLVADNFKLVLQLGAAFVAAQFASTVLNMGIAFFGLARAVQATGLMMAAVEAIRAISLRGWLMLAGILIVATGNFGTFKDKLSEVASYVGSVMPDGAGVLGGALKTLGIDLSALSADLVTYKDRIDNAAKGQKDFNFAAMGGKNAVDQFVDSQMKAAAAQSANAATLGKSAADQAYLKTVYEGQAVALSKGIPLTAALNAQITQAGQAAAQAAATLQAAQIAQDVMTPAEKYAQDLANLQQVYQTTDMTAETFARKQQALAEAVGATWEQAGAGMASGFAQLAGSFAKNSKEMAVAAKAFGIIEATINTYVAFTKALTSAPPPFNYVMAAGVLAAGMAKVVAIKSQSFAMGGYVSGPGTSVSDSIPANLSNGEFVMNAQATSQFRPQLEAMNGGGGAPKVIELRGLGDKRYTLDEVRRIIDGINEAIPYGIQLKLT